MGMVALVATILIELVHGRQLVVALLVSCAPLSLPAVLTMRPKRLRHAALVRYRLSAGDPENPLGLTDTRGAVLAASFIVSFVSTVAFSLAHAG